MSGAELTLYFDGKCPFCRAGMARLAQWDQAGHLAFVDIAAPGFDPAHLGVDIAALNRELHSQTRDGRVLAGIDSMLRAYTLAGQAWRVLPLRVPGLRTVCSWSYRLFARHRYLMSRVLGYRAPVCAEGVCERPNPFFKR
ncbi:thiol-disulfide oxidoreductase DCC family protein [Massilia antarctica]|uniref:thiol-disulfide oxidoreductase DCC family protein n=1 Tax=Massilia antarctica TaxID=2765360 RepID=UPI0006BB59C9|nr:DUF393 domain-containing protein [Massilia sp. H27-R4]MCY0911494.1 DUF393 domain-containing protein [Massilia sp. H27-R4]CUI04898.1 Cell division inhibitor [Janthinobacterium sp. CG23_2]CUU28684.1 Cell division inhibitor [Janthinobacterium sp. CG23_2]